MQDGVHAALYKSVIHVYADAWKTLRGILMLHALRALLGDGLVCFCSILIATYQRIRNIYACGNSTYAVIRHVGSNLPSYVRLRDT